MDGLSLPKNLYKLIFLTCLIVSGREYLYCEKVSAGEHSHVRTANMRTQSM